MTISANFYVYEHIRKDTGAVFYVGKGRNKRAQSLIGRNNHWKNVVNKANGYAIKYVVKNVDEELAFLCEIEKIDQLKRIGIKLTNMTNGGDGMSGYVATEETRKKITSAKLGFKYTEESKKKMSESAKGRIVSKETRDKISFHSKNRKLTQEHIGKLLNSKARQEYLKKIKKPVLCVTTGVVYHSLMEAARQTNCTKQAISLCCYGKQKQTGGYKFQWSVK